MKFIDKPYFGVLIETLYDIWMLSLVVQPGNLIYTKFQRKVKLPGGNKDKVSTKLFSGNIKLTEVKEEEKGLRLKGTIEEEFEHVSKGSSQTVQYGIGDVLFLPEISREQKALLEEHMKNKQYFYCIVLLNDQEIYVFEVSPVASQLLMHKQYDGGKYKDTEQILLSKKLDVIKDIIEVYDYIIFAAPHLYHKELQEYLKQSELTSLVVPWTDIRPGALGALQHMLTEEQKLGDTIEGAIHQITKEFQAALAKNRVAYGKEQVKQALEAGRVLKMVCTAQLLKDIDKKELFSFIQLCKDTQADYMLLSQVGDESSVLDSFSGLVAILRY